MIWDQAGMMNRPAKILIADDNDILLKATQRAMQGEGYEVFCARDGYEALEMVRGQQPDLVLLDANMPGMDGFEVLRRIKSDPMTATTFVVIVSGSRVDTDSLTQGLETGADGYITRPIQNRELAARVRSLLRIKAAEDAVRRQEEQLRVLIASNRDGMLVVDEQKLVLFGNRAAREMLNSSGEELEGMDVGIPLTTGERVEVELPGKEDSHRIVEIYTTKIEWQAKPAWLASLRDITHLKQIEQKILQLNRELEAQVNERTRELRQAQEKLLRQERLAALGQLGVSIGHELRGPLGVITNAIFFLKSIDPDASPKKKEYYSLIEQQVQTAEKIISDLLNFARIKSSDPKPVALPDVLNEVFERFPVPPEVNVVVDLPADLPQILVDQQHLGQVLGNLVLNACQAMPSGGVLTVKAHQVGEEVSIAVQDTGVGISPDNLDRIFEPLFTTKPKGIGLGLAVCKQLIEVNNGRIEVQSQPGVGAVFTVILPVFSLPNPDG